MANDRIQILREAIVQVLDARAEIAAITGRATDNIVAWSNLGTMGDAERNAGIIAYHLIVSSEGAADQNPQDPMVQFAAVAAEESICNEIIGVIAQVVDAPAFLGLIPPLDARATSRVRRSFPFDSDEKLARADIDITLRVHFP